MSVILTAVRAYKKHKKNKNKPQKKITVNSKGLLSAVAERQKKLDAMLKKINNGTK